MRRERKDEKLRVTERKRRGGAECDGVKRETRGRKGDVEVVIDRLVSPRAPVAELIGVAGRREVSVTSEPFRGGAARVKLNETSFSPPGSRAVSQAGCEASSFNQRQKSLVLISSIFSFHPKGCVI